MIAAFATLAFLAALWLVGLIAATMLETSGGKILAALTGRSLLAQPPVAVLVPVSRRAARVRTPVRAAARLRAAA